MCLPSCPAICLPGTNSKMARRMGGEEPSATMMVPGCTNNNSINNSTISNNNSISNNTNNNNSSISEGPDLPEQLSSSNCSSFSSKTASELQSFPAHPR